MDRTLKNTISVLVVTLFVALAVFGTVQLTGAAIGSTGSGSASQYAVASSSYGTQVANAGSAGTMTCPRTGCSANTCHAAR